MLLGVVMGFAQYPRTTFQVPECIFKMAGSRYPENRTEDACSLYKDLFKHVSNVGQ